MSARSLQLNPLNTPATTAQIKAKRDEIEQSPVTTTFGTFDADDKSLARLKAALNYFAELPTVSGEIEWTLADNTTVMLTETELGDVIEELGEAWAIRSATVHIAAQALPGTNVTVGELDNLMLWGL